MGAHATDIFAGLPRPTRGSCWILAVPGASAWDVLLRRSLDEPDPRSAHERLEDALRAPVWAAEGGAVLDGLFPAAKARALGLTLALVPCAPEDPLLVSLRMPELNLLPPMHWESRLPLEVALARARDGLDGVSAEELDGSGSSSDPLWAAAASGDGPIDGVVRRREAARRPDAESGAAALVARAWARRLLLDEDAGIGSFVLEPLDPAGAKDASWTRHPGLEAVERARASLRERLGPTRASGAGGIPARPR